MRVYLTVFAASCVALACSTGQELEPPISSSTSALIQIVFDGPTAYADARFSRARGIATEDAELLAGLQSPTGLALDRCRIDGDDSQLERALAGLPTDALVLLDAGEIELSVAGHVAAMSPIQKPALYPYVLGVQYESASINAAPSQIVRVSSVGGADIGAFDVHSVVPPSVSDVTVRQDDSGRIQLRWRGTYHPSGAFAVAELSSGRQLRCRTADDGALTLSREVVPVGDGIVAIGVERWISANFVVAGADAATLEVGVRRVVSARALE